MPERHRAYIGLGANLADPTRQIRTAIQELAQLPQTTMCRHSGLYTSKPAGHADQPDYINAVAELDTQLPPRGLLDALLEIERRHGRERTFRNSPRTLDLDLLLYDQLRVDEPGLHIPHPRMHERAFVLLPLLEIASGAVLPGHGRVADILERIDRNAASKLPDTKDA